LSSAGHAQSKRSQLLKHPYFSLFFVLGVTVALLVFVMGILRWYNSE
jgi:hypothetical protein